MKTKPAQRDMLREVYARTHESCKWVGNYLNPQPVMIDLIDDIEELESKLRVAVEALNQNIMVFSDLMSRSKAPDSWMIVETKEALSKITQNEGGEYER